MIIKSFLYSVLNAVLMLGCVVLMGCQQNDAMLQSLVKASEHAIEYEESFTLTQYDVTQYESYATRISRDSAVKVEIDYGHATIRGTGTYFKYKGHYMVVTAAHLFAMGGGQTLVDEAIITTPNEKVMGKLLYIDKYVDIAIFAAPKLQSRKAAKFSRAKSYPIGAPVYYSGFPGANNLLTFTGTLSGEGYGTDIAMHSFAWGGSSGSGVFDEQGQFVGVLVSIMVGPGYMGPQLVGSVVYIAPADLIDSAYLRQQLDKVGRMKNDGF